MLTYLEELTVRLATRVAALPEATRQRHGDYYERLQCADGGFPGRDGESDLYYTGFAVRSLAILGRLDGPLAERIAEYLRGKLSGRESIVDFVSLIYAATLLDSATGIDVFDDAPADWPDMVGSALEDLRCQDGGYAKGPSGAAGSTYHTFLVVVCLQLLDRPLPHPERVVDFVLSRCDDEGGFREIRASKRAGTNPTAAAIATLRILDALPEDVAEQTVDFLATMQTEEGGLRANTRIPIADLLSTFTGLLTLDDLGALDAIDTARALRYVRSLEGPKGGFHGAAWDDQYDVEYSFYGLGSLALLAAGGAKAGR